MVFRKLFLYRGMGINLLAGLCFLLLAVFGWGLGWGIIGNYLLAITGILIGIIIVAALPGWLLRKWLRNRTRAKKLHSQNKK